MTDEIAFIGLRGLTLMVSVLGSERVSYSPPSTRIIVVSVVPFPFTLVCSLWGLWFNVDNGI